MEGDEMLSKVFTKYGHYCLVTFRLPADVHANTANLCGDFNNWSTKSHPMERQPDGSFSLTLRLKFGHDYRFRYFVDGYCWFNDNAADGYVTNQFDNLDSIVCITKKININ
jgi:1,4-alpha-glucan branching enzyme